MTSLPNDHEDAASSDLRAEDLLLRPVASKHHHHHHHHHKKHRSARRVLLSVLACLLGIVVIACGTFAVLQERGRRALLNTDAVQLVAPDDEQIEVEISDDGRRVVYQGETYLFDTQRTNILFLGTDKTSLGLEDGVVGTGGQADTILLLSISTQTGAISVLAISRDTMADIDEYTADGSFYGVENTQICLAYAYGDGRETSCENMVRAVSRLLYGIPINTYFAMDLSTVATLNDEIGGVQLTLMEDFQTTAGIWYYAGNSITLYGEEATRYVRNRDKDVLDSNNARMARQKQYLNAFFEQAMEATREDIQVPLSLYGTIMNDSVTDLTISKMTYLATCAVSHQSTLQFYQVPGTVVEGEDGLAEYRVDEAALYEQVLSLFYIKQ